MVPTLELMWGWVGCADYHGKPHVGEPAGYQDGRGFGVHIQVCELRLGGHNQRECILATGPLRFHLRDPLKRLCPSPSRPGSIHSVKWEPTDVKFSRRFERYLDYNFFEHQIHWFSIFNSFMMVIFLTGLVSLILMRTLRNDYAKYRREEDDVEALDRELSEVRRVSPAPCAPVCC